LVSSQGWRLSFIDTQQKNNTQAGVEMPAVTTQELATNCPHDHRGPDSNHSVHHFNARVRQFLIRQDLAAYLAIIGPRQSDPITV